MSNKSFSLLFMGFILIFSGFISGCSLADGSGGKEEVIYFLDFENGLGDWLPRGSASIKVVSGIAHSGSHSLHVSSRSKTWQGAILPITFLKPGRTYRFSAWLMYNDDSAPSQGMSISIQQEIAGRGETYNNIAGERLPKGEWVYIEGEYTVPLARYETVLSLYFEGRYKADEDTQKSDLFDFYIDDITITRLPPMPPPEVEKNIPALYEYFKDDFPLGTAIDYNFLSSKNINNDLLRHFNVYVYGNEMKPDALEPSEGRFFWDKADALVEYVQKNDKKMRGHTLLWHQQTPSWFFMGSGPDGLATKAQLYARMEKHIKEIVTRYKGKVHTWDVVNEVMGDDGELRNSRFFQIVGSYEYIAKAFQWAHEADPDALLCLNDFGIESSGAKQDGFYNLLQTLLDEGVPVHVAGIQAHINVSWPTVADLRQLIRRLSSLGLKVQITELDISIYADGGEPKKKADREILLLQANKYRSLFDMFRDEAREGNLDMVIVWGITDAGTWLDNHPVPGRTDYPLFFGKDYRAKPAYWAIVDPSRLPIQIKRIDATFTDHSISDINDKAWYLVSPRDIADNKGAVYGSFKAMWDSGNLYLRLTASADSKDAKLKVFIEPKNQKLEERSDIAFTKEFSLSSAVADASGLTYLALIPLEGKLDAKIGFDLCLDNTHSWNDWENGQEKSSLNYGTVNLRMLPMVTYAKRGTVDMTPRTGRAARDLDPVWNDVTPVPLTINSGGFTSEGSQFRALWDDQYLYVLTEVVTSNLDKKSNIVHEQDSVEVFVDQNNGKTSIFELDDGQYRVNFENEASYNGGDRAMFKSRTIITANGYRVEMACPLYSITPKRGHIIGFDVQINDAANGARQGIRNWANDTNQGYQSTADYGILVFE
jgi:endo-1,4-beta-xylanase